MYYCTAVRKIQFMDVFAKCCNVLNITSIVCIFMQKNHCAKLPLNCATELGDVVVNSLFRVKLLSEQSHWRVSVHLS